jgi:hypothetical protein
MDEIIENNGESPQEEIIEQPKLGMNINAKIILSCTITLVIFLSGAMFYMFHYLDELSKSPFTMGAIKTVEVNNAEDLLCSCSLIGATSYYQDRNFYFNTTTVWSNGEDYLVRERGVINFSNFNLSS